ncbi:hypothetical protein [uncultured Nitrospira sp.]|uniref:hypothetical protein n=1 Tax=uncultured Nitrospira sp. TaxID=157176 RepID=UPI0031407B08
MKVKIHLTMVCLVLFPVLALAQGGENMGPKCQKLAHEFSEDPNSLNEMELTQLQFCVTQTIERRHKTNPPDLLRGTIIEPPVSSNGSEPKSPAP